MFWMYAVAGSRRETYQHVFLALPGRAGALALMSVVMEISAATRMAAPQASANGVSAG